MRNIGDRVWIAKLKYTEFNEQCPDCLGDKTVILALKNGESHELECHTCNPGGFQPSRGYITKSQYQGVAEQRTIEGMEIGRDHNTYKFYDHYCHEVFDSQEEALKATEKIKKEKQDDDFRRFQWKKEDSRRNWAWNCAYYRRQIANAKRDLAYAEARLGICRSKMKDAVDVMP